MGVPTFIPPVRPSPGTGRKPTVNLWEADFGDGYSQPTPKGINHIRQTVTLLWKVLTVSQMREIEAFFERMAGNQPFYFQPWGERGAGKWTCKEWTSNDNGGTWSVNASLIASRSNAR